MSPLVPPFSQLSPSLRLSFASLSAIESPAFSAPKPLIEILTHVFFPGFFSVLYANWDIVEIDFA